MLAQLRFSLRQAGRGLRRGAGVSALTTATLTAGLLLLGLYAMLMQNLHDLVRTWGRPGQLVAVLELDLPAAAWEATRASLAALPGVAEASLVPPELALARFRDQGAEAAELVAGVDPELLPALVQVQLHPGADLAQLQRLAEAVQPMAGVAEVDSGAEELRGLGLLLRALRLGGLAFSLCITALVGFIVANTIRLAIDGRRQEIAILQLVGATRRFIGAPFLLEGAAWGATGGSLALLLLYGLDRLAAPQLAQLMAELAGPLAPRLFAWPLGLALWALGLALGLGGSAVAVHRALNAEGHAC